MSALAVALLLPSLAAAPTGAAKQRPAAARKTPAPPKKVAPEENPKLGGAAKAFAKARVRFEAPADRTELQPGDVTVRLAITGYALIGGAHAHLIVDNQPALQVDDASRPLTLTNVAPGPHLLRAVLCRPWHEVVKAPQAFALTRFWSGPREPGRAAAAAEREAWPDPKRPLLTYVLPLGEPRPDDAKLEVATPVASAVPAAAVTVTTATAPSTDPNLGGGTNGIAEPPPPPPPTPPAAPVPTAPTVQQRPRPPALDFYLSHAKLDRRSYKVRVVLDRAELQLVKSWEPRRLPRLRPGRHHIAIDLLDRRALKVPGALNRTDRVFRTH